MEYDFRRYGKTIVLHHTGGGDYDWSDIFPVVQNDTIRKIMYSSGTNKLLIIYRRYLNKDPFNESLSFRELMEKLGE